MSPRFSLSVLSALVLPLWLAGCASNAPVASSQDGYDMLTRAMGLDVIVRREVDSAMAEMERVYAPRSAEMICARDVFNAEGFLADFRPVFAQLMTDAEMRSLAEYFQTSGGRKMLSAFDPATQTQTDPEALLSQLTDDELTQMAQHIVVFRRLASPEARKMMHRYSTLVGEKTAHKVIEQCLAPGDKLAL